MPRISDTTAMIDVTATMLPSTVMNDRSLPAQMAASARRMASMNFCMRRPCRASGPVLRFLGLHGVPFLQVSHRIEGAGDHLVARLESVQHLEVLVAGDAGLDRDERRGLVLDQEDALGVLPLLAVGQRIGRAHLGGRR